MKSCLANQERGIKQDLQSGLNELHDNTPATQLQVKTPELADP